MFIRLSGGEVIQHFIGVYVHRCGWVGGIHLSYIGVMARWDIILFLKKYELSILFYFYLFFSFFPLASDLISNQHRSASSIILFIV